MYDFLTSSHWPFTINMRWNEWRSCCLYCWCCSYCCCCCYYCQSHTISTRIRVRHTSICNPTHYHNIYVSMKLTVYVHVQRFLLDFPSVMHLLCLFFFCFFLSFQWHISTPFKMVPHTVQRTNIQHTAAITLPFSNIFTWVFVSIHLPHTKCVHTLTLIINIII